MRSIKNHPPISFPRAACQEFGSIIPSSFSRHDTTTATVSCHTNTHCSFPPCACSSYHMHAHTGGPRSEAIELLRYHISHRRWIDPHQSAGDITYDKGQSVSAPCSLSPPPNPSLRSPLLAFDGKGYFASGCARFAPGGAEPSRAELSRARLWLGSGRVMKGPDAFQSQSRRLG